MGEEQKKEIIELLSQNDNILKAHSLVENWNDIKWQTEFDFWSDMESLVSKEYIVLNDQKYSEKNLNSVIYQSRNRNAYYGIMFEIGKYKGESVCLFIERGWWNVYYGLTVLKNGKRTITDDGMFDELANKIANYCIWPKEEAWLGGNFLIPNINFESFADDVTLRLCNVEHRQKIIEENWVNIKEFIKKCKSSIII